MTKQELTRRLARRSRQSQGDAADKVDALVYKLWKESGPPEQIVPVPARDGDAPEVSTAPVKGA